MTLDRPIRRPCSDTSGLSALSKLVILTTAVSSVNACESVNGLDIAQTRGDRYCLQAGGLGALGGAAGGAGLGYLLGDERGALIGAVLGGAIGLVTACRYGVWVADRREHYDSEQERLSAELENAQRTNISLAELNDELLEGLQERQQSLASVRARGLRDQQALQQRQQIAQELNENEQGIKQQLAEGEKELATHHRVLVQLQQNAGNAQQAEIEEYERRIALMEGEVNELHAIAQQYAQARAAAV